jgi:hypothetical protein
MTLQLLEALCEELLQPDCQRSAVLAALSDAELQDASADVLRQYGLELFCGAYEHSSWMGELLMIAGNEGPIKACAAAFLAVLVEMDRRGISARCGQEQRR